MNANARRMEINLMTLGTGVILFGAWTFIKLAVYYLINGVDFGLKLPDVVVTATNIIVWGVVALSFLIHIYIGISARSESRGKHKTVFYLIVTGIVVFLELLTVIGEFSLFFTGQYGLLTVAVTLVIDSTAMVMLIEVMVNAVRLRKLRKKEAAA